MKLRAFLAVPLGEPARGRMVSLQEALAVRGLRFRWVVPDRMHLTLRFLGEHSEEAIEAFAEAVGAVESFAGESFCGALEEVTAFPDPTRPRVVIVRVGEASGRLEVLAREVEEAARECGFEAEARSWRPHLTLGRAPRRARLSGFDPIPLVPSEPLPIEEALLYRSDLTSTGPRYSVLRRFRFWTDGDVS